MPPRDAPRPGRSSVPSAAAAAGIIAAALLLAGCSRETPDVRAVRKAAQRYIHALAREDVEALRALATNLAPSGSVRGGRVLEVEPSRLTRFGNFDSLASAAGRRQAEADSLWGHVPEAVIDSLFQISRRSARAQVVYRNAQRAALASASQTLLSGDAAVETRRIRVRIRYGGPLVGPRPIDRELTLRLLRVAEGPWIVYSLYLPEDDPLGASN